jgi:hypothetical protein
MSFVLVRESRRPSLRERGFGRVDSLSVSSYFVLYSVAMAVESFVGQSSKLNFN